MVLPDAENAVTTPRRVRMSPSARRADLVTSARAVLIDEGDAGVAEIARAAGVSKALLYRYFPAGRAELIAAVVTDLGDELLSQVRQAGSMPFSSAMRLEQVLAAVFAFFNGQPGAYPLLVSRPPTDSAAESAEQLRGVRAELVGTISGLMADGGRPAEEVLAASTGLVGFVFATVELCLNGQLSPERAWQLSCRCARLICTEPD